MTRLRIMHVVDSFGTGGTEGGIRKLLAGLDPAAFEQVVCTIAPAQSESQANARIVSVGRAEGGRQFLVGRMKRLFDQERPHIVHSRNWGAIEAIMAAKLSCVRGIVHSEHGLESSNYRRQPWRRNLIRRVCFPWAHRLFAVSLSLRDYYAEQLSINKDRIGVITNGVDAERFRPDGQMRCDARQKLNAGPDTLVVGTVGRLDPIKGHRTLFQAVEFLLTAGIAVQLVVVGDGPERKALEEDVHNRNPLALKTVFAGASNDVVSHLNSFDVFVLPSVAEGLSNSLLEAMATGVACVASRVGGNSELIEDGVSGLLFEANDSSALAAHLRTLASNANHRRELGVEARRRVVSFFSLHGMMANYAQMYENILSHQQRHSLPSDYQPVARTRQGYGTD